MVVMVSVGRVADFSKEVWDEMIGSGTLVSRERLAGLEGVMFPELAAMLFVDECL
jgi:hypothetical protein